MTTDRLDKTDRKLSMAIEKLADIINAYRYVDPLVAARLGYPLDLDEDEYGDLKRLFRDLQILRAHRTSRRLGPL